MQFGRGTKVHLEKKGGMSPEIPNEMIFGTKL